MDLTKTQLTRLMELDNPKANAYLDEVALRLQKEIEESSSNDDILERLELLESFIYRVANTAVQVIDFVIKNPHDQIIKKTSWGDLTGKSHADLVLKCVQLLNLLRYIDPDSILKRVVALIDHEDSKVVAAAKSTLGQFAKFDFHVLTKTKAGYSAQGKALEFIKQWTPAEQLEHFDAFVIVTSQLLRSSIEGSSMETEDTITIHMGAVQPNDYLKTLRRETIDLIINLYNQTDEDSLKLQLVNILEEALRSPLHGSSDEVLSMIVDDAQYLIKLYKTLLFDRDNRLISSIPVAEAVEKMLYWFGKDGPFNTSEARQLREDILADPFYSLFHILVGDDLTFGDEDWDKADARRSAEIDSMISQIEEANLGKWINDLNRVASQSSLINEWQFRHFNVFLRNFARGKADLSRIILDDALKNNKPITHFTAYLLDGYRDAARFDLWDSFVDKIAEIQNPRLISAIAYSLVLSSDADPVERIREEDLNILEDLVLMQGRFEFLQGEEDNSILRHAVITALVRDYRRDPQRIERLIIEELTRHPSLKEIQVRALGFGTRRWIDYSAFTPDGIRFLKGWFLTFKDLDYQAQEILLEIGKQDLQSILDVFWGRIEKVANEDTPLLDTQRYEAIPYHINENLQKYISEHPEFLPQVEAWLEKVTPEWSKYNWYIGQFLGEMGHSLEGIILTFIHRGGDIDLLKATQLICRFGKPSVNLLMEIVKRTDDEKILDQLGAQLYATGVVVGEYGLAEAHEGMAETLSSYLKDPSERIRMFASKMIESLRRAAQRDRARADEEKQLRKIEFEG